MSGLDCSFFSGRQEKEGDKDEHDPDQKHYMGQRQ